MHECELVKGTELLGRARATRSAQDDHDDHDDDDADDDDDGQGRAV